MKIWGQDLNIMSMWDILQTVLGRSTRGPSEGKQDTGLKAHLFGFGTNDETLFWEAVALAEAKRWMDKPEGRQNLNAILKGLTGYWEKRRFYHLIGQDSQSVVIEVHTESTGPTPPVPLRTRRRSRAADPGPTPGATTTVSGDGERVEKTTMNGNIRGAMIVAFFAGMPPADAIAFLKHSGTLKGIPDDVAELYRGLMKFLGERDFGRILARMNAGAEEAVLWYLGATSIEEAEAVVSAKEREVARRRAQSWFRRDLIKRPGLLVSWAFMLAILIGGSIYVFVMPH